MKNKFLLAAALVIVSTASSLANAGQPAVPGDVVSAFQSDFSTSGKVIWETGNGYYKAAFIQSGFPVYAYYSTSGDLMGFGRQLTTDMIPVSMDKQLQKDYAGYTLSEVYELGAEKSGDFLLILKKDNRVLRVRNLDGELVVVR